MMDKYLLTMMHENKIFKLRCKEDMHGEDHYRDARWHAHPQGS